MFYKTISVLAVLAWVGIAVYADMLFKRAPNLMSWVFAVGAILYASTGFLAFYVYRVQQWGWVAITWNVVALGMGLAISILFYNEPFTLRRLLASLLLLAAFFIAE